jgi:hypothetical protein
MPSWRWIDTAKVVTGITPIATSGFRTGAICYLGQGKYAVGDDSGIDIVDATAKTATKDRTLVTLTGLSGTGFCKALATNKRGKLLALLGQNVGSPSVRTTKLRQYDLDTGTLDWQFSFGDSGNEGALLYTGKHWYMSYQGTSVPADRFLELDISGKGVTITRNIAHNQTSPASTMFNAMTYDGMFVWARTGAFVSRWDVNQRLPPRNCFGGAGGAALPGSAHGGIAATRTGHIALLSGT